MAGMEGALASVVGGLVRAPVIAVPTSIGYGSSFDGLAALLAHAEQLRSGCVGGQHRQRLRRGVYGGDDRAWAGRERVTREARWSCVDRDASNAQASFADAAIVWLRRQILRLPTPDPRPSCLTPYWLPAEKWRTS